MSEKPTLKQILPQLQSWCAVNNVSVQSVYDECHGMTLQEIVYYLFGVVKQASEEVVDYEGQFEELYNYVHDYFDNLDVQEEINNKINEMLNDGSLASYFSQYMTFNIDTTVNMRNTNLPEGAIVHTNGYYEKLDNGGATFIISETEPSDKIYYVLSNGKYAIYDSKNIYLDEIGAKSDPDFDNKDIFDLAFNNASNYNNTIYLSAKNYYTSNLYPNYGNFRLIGTSSEYYPDYLDDQRTYITALSTNGILLNLTQEETPRTRIVIENITFNGNNKIDTCLNCNRAITLNKCVFLYANNYGLTLQSPTYPVFINGGGCYYNLKGMLVNSPYSTYYSVNNFEISRNTYGLDILASQCALFTNLVLQNNTSYAIRLKRETSSYMSGITFINTFFEGNGSLETSSQHYTGNYNIILDGSEVTFSNIRFINGFINTANGSNNFNIVNVSPVTLTGISFSNNSNDVVQNSTLVVDNVPTNYGGSPNYDNTLATYKYPTKVNAPFVFKSYGEGSPFSNVKTFTLTLDEIAASSNAQMTFDGNMNGLPITGNFVILQLCVGKKYNKVTSPNPQQENGSLNFFVTYGSQSIPTLKLTTERNAYLDNTETTGWRSFGYWRADTLVVGASGADASIGVRVEASSDYSTSENIASKKIYATITIAEI